MVLVDLDKGYDTVPRELIWYCLRKKQVPEEYIELSMICMHNVQHQSYSSRDTEEVSIEDGLHQGSVLGRFLLILIMDTITL